MENVSKAKGVKRVMSITPSSVSGVANTSIHRSHRMQPSRISSVYFITIENCQCPYCNCNICNPRHTPCQPYLHSNLVLYLHNFPAEESPVKANLNDLIVKVYELEIYNAELCTNWTIMLDRELQQAMHEGTARLHPIDTLLINLVHLYAGKFWRKWRKPYKRIFRFEITTVSLNMNPEEKTIRFTICQQCSRAIEKLSTFFRWQTLCPSTCDFTLKLTLHYPRGHLTVIS